MENKVKSCLNCGEELNTDQNYCPNCGQENSDKKLPLSAFLKDFFSNYLSFDTVLFKTINPFIFRPGKLTKAFNEGKRRRYINPIRLYLIFSLFYFFMISLTVPKDFIDSSLKSIVNKKDLFDSVKVDQLDSARIEKLVVDVENTKKKLKLNNTKDYWTTLKLWANNDNLTDAEFKKNIDSVGLKIDIISVEPIRSFIANSSIFTYQSIRNLPVMMFFFLPVFALILHLLYFKNRFYVEHLIHGLHLHAFAYFIYGLAILLLSLFPLATGWVVFLSFLWVSSYTLFSIKKLYQNGWAKTIFKFFTLGFFYFILLGFGILLELYVSLMTI